MFDFLGYRPSLGELIIVAVLAVLAERSARVLSRIIDYLTDSLASSFSRARNFQVRRLEKRLDLIVTLENDNRLATGLLLRRIYLTVILTLLLLLLYLVMLEFNVQTTFGYLFSALGLHIELGAGWMKVQNIPQDKLLYFSLVYGVMRLMFMLVLAIVLFIAFRSIRDFSDLANPEKAIKTLQERISALRAKA